MECKHCQQDITGRSVTGCKECGRRSGVHIFVRQGKVNEILELHCPRCGLFVLKMRPKPEGGELHTGS